MADFKKGEVVFKALANRRRIVIVAILTKQTRMSVGAIAKELKLSLEATSRHLTILYKADMIEREQEASVVYYSINKEEKITNRIIDLLAYLRK